MLQDRRQHFVKSKYVRQLAPILGGGIVLAEGEDWLRQRQLAAKGFRAALLKAMVADMNAAGDDLIRRWRAAAAAGRPLDIAREMMHVTLDVALRGLMGARLAGDYAEVYDSLTIILTDSERRFWSFWREPRWWPGRANRAYRDALHCLDRVVYRIIDERHRGGAAARGSLAASARRPAAGVEDGAPPPHRCAGSCATSS